MRYTCIIAFTGSLVGSSNPVQQSSPAIQSTNPVHNPVQRLETADDAQQFSTVCGCWGVTGIGESCWVSSSVEVNGCCRLKIFSS